MIIENLGITQEMRCVVTSPFSPTISFIAFTESLSTLRGETLGYSCLIFPQIRQSGTCTRSLNREKVCACTPDSVSSIPLWFHSRFHQLNENFAPSMTLRRLKN